MELSKQVVSLELAKKLKTLGVKQESLFYWEKIDWEGKQANLRYKRETSVHDGWLISAFTVAELGEMLPDYLWLKKQCFLLRVYKYKKGVWEYTYTGHKPENAVDATIQPQSADTESDARAKMLVYLIKNKLMEM